MSLIRDKKATGDVVSIRADLDRKWVATMGVRERMRDSAEDCVAGFRHLGMAVRIMTGDNLAGAQRVSHLGEAEFAMTPEDKHRAVVELTSTNPQLQRPVFIGDGLNDAAAMAASHTSIAMSHGSAVARETASFVFDGEDLTQLPHAVALARSACRVILSNFIWAVTYNSIGIALAAAGVLHPVVAAVLMAASSALVS